MSQREEWKLDEAAFERQLLGSAAQDEPPEAASERAFRELAADVRALAGLTALAPLAAESGPRVAPRAPRRAVPQPALAGLLLGAVAGGSLVALWLQLAAEPPALVPPVPPRPLPELLVPELEPEPVAAPRLAAPAQGQSELLPRAQRGRAKARSAAERASRLAREVALLDAARAALAVGAAESTLRQIERYRAELPDGELAADAEAVAIEALAAKGDHAALADAARRFLARHPRDPHAARVRELAFIKPPR